MVGIAMLACGSRTALELPTDAGSPTDAGTATRDAGPPCEPVAETCNLRDDDCDGATDEGIPPTTLSDSILVRMDGDQRTGDCPHCTRAAGPELIRTRDGLQLYFLVDFLFLEPAPNLYHRPLDAHGNPIGEAELLVESWAVLYQRIDGERWADGRALLPFCERLPDGTDRPAAVVLGPSGRAVEVAPFDAPHECGGFHGFSTLRVGEDLLVAWSRSSGDDPVMVMGYAPPGLHPQRPTALALEEDERIFGMSHAHDRVVLRGSDTDYVEHPDGSITSDGAMTLHLLDRDLRPAASVTRLADDSGHVLLAPRTSGWFLYEHDAGELRRREISVDGRMGGAATIPLASPIGGMLGADGDTTGAAVVYQGDRSASVSVLWLTPDGEVGGSWRPDDGVIWTDVRVLRDGGVTWIAYVERIGGGRSDRSNIRLRRLSCVAD